MNFDLGLFGAPGGPSAVDDLAATSREAHRVLDEQWGLLVAAFFACNWFGGDRQAFNDRYTALKEDVERLRADLAVMPVRLADAARETHEARRAIAYRVGPGVGVAWDLLDRVVD
jgi:hypothetical protein